MRVPGECGGSDVFQRLARAVWSRYHRGGIRRSGDCVSFRLGVRDEYGVSGFLMSRIEARFTKLANMFQKSVPKMSLGFFKTASAHTAWHAITSPIYERLIGGESQALALSDGVSVG
jgi:hypothetical protein